MWPNRLWTTCCRRCRVGRGSSRSGCRRGSRTGAIRCGDRVGILPGQGGLLRARERFPGWSRGMRWIWRRRWSGFSRISSSRIPPCPTARSSLRRIRLSSFRGIGGRRSWGGTVGFCRARRQIARRWSGSRRRSRRGGRSRSGCSTTRRTACRSGTCSPWRRSGTPRVRRGSWWGCRWMSRRRAPSRIRRPSACRLRAWSATR
mmetsp:Transcript_12950/g.37213  ORF Transcript_12950/g.37213 Transcript_12950/m.37213 type:complete len:203 (-) Transcript_12950:2325-2933(-)